MTANPKVKGLIKSKKILSLAQEIIFLGFLKLEIKQFKFNVTNKFN